jgi:hypothetical protein
MLPEEPSNFDCVAHGMTAAEFRQLMNAYQCSPVFLVQKPDGCNTM